MKIHPTAEVSTENIGRDTVIWQFCIILDGAIIGSGCNINCNVLIEGDVIIGDFVTIKPCVQIWDGIIIESHVFIGPNVTFTNDKIPRSREYSNDWKNNKNRFKNTVVKKGATIGANATILAGLEIGEYALIGAGTVVTKNIPPFTVWYGNPAKQKGFITKDGIILDMNLMCKNNKKYHFSHDDIIPV